MQRSADRVFWSALVLLGVLRLLASALAPISGDEAYYWLWAQRPDWGYYDHPPMVAWLIALSTSLLGHSPFAIRLPSVLLGLAVPILGRHLALDLSGNPDVGRTTGLLLMVVPYLGVEGATATPDAPLLFFWTLSVLLFWQAQKQGQRWRWLVAGGVFGLAVLSKLMAALLLPALVLWMLWQRRFSWGGLVLALIGAVLVCAGFIAWNLQHHWEPVLFQLLLRHQQTAPPTGLVGYMAMQAEAVSPFLFVGCLVALGWSALQKNSGTAWLACCGMLPLLVFGTFSLREPVEIFWSLEAYVPLIVALAWMLSAVRMPNVPRMAALVVMIVPGLLLSLAIYLGSLSPGTWLRLTQTNARPGFTGNDITELQALEPLARDLTTLDAFVVTEHYGLSAALWYYGGRQTYTLPLSLLGREFQRWQQDLSPLRGRDAVFVDRSPLSRRADVKGILAASFEALEELPPRRYEKDGQLARVFFLTRCRNFKGRFVVP